MPHTSPVLDAWASLSHKAPLNGVVPNTATVTLAPTWVGTHKRRLDAYTVLKAYLENYARHFIATTDEAKKRRHREYGDARLLVEAIRAAVLGDDFQIVVEGADEELEEPGEGETETPEERALRAEVEAAIERQDWLRDDWGVSERVKQKVIETERNATGLGDGVYLVSWSSLKERPKLRVYDPGMYFPVFPADGGDGEEFPDKVHLAWQYDDEDGNTYVRRITYELVPVEAWTPAYHEPGEKPATVTCLLTDATWPLPDINEQRLDDFLLSKATFRVNDAGTEVRDLDIERDYIPLVHEPNTVAILEGFGRSCIASVAQILDDIAFADTDLSLAAATTGTPPIGVDPGDGATSLAGSTTTYGPGTVLYGKVNLLDTSTALDALLKWLDELLRRLSSNSRVPEEVLGRVSAGDIASGVLLALSFGPFRALVDEMRLVREEKYGLLFKFVQREAIAGGLIDGPVMNANLAFGSYLPSDLSAVVELVVKLLEQHGISRRTALTMLVDAGLEVGTIEEEIERIEHEDFDGAVKIADATEDANLSREYLGYEAVTQTPTVPELPAPEDILPEPEAQ